MRPHSNASVDRRDDLTAAQRFWSRVNKTSACWEWTGPRIPQGYGTTSVPHTHSRVMRAHRLAWEFANGAIPAGLSVLHRCDNPPCVRPDHLFLGTQRDNVEDAKQKGRIQSGEQHWSQRMPGRIARGPKVHAKKQYHGSANKKAKLTEAKVAEIKCRFTAGGVTKHALASEYGVTDMTIHNILAGKSWKHVQIPPFM